MFIKSSVFLLMLILVAHRALAEPPFDVIQSCMGGKNDAFTLKIADLEDDGFISTPDAFCEAQYSRHFGTHFFGTVVCEDEFFLILNHKKVRLDTAINHSLNSKIKPGIPFSVRSFWKKIDFKDQAYLCIESPLSESGAGASINQYYIVEHGFEETKMPIVYYYFFNGDIKPVFPT